MTASGIRGKAVAEAYSEPSQTSRWSFLQELLTVFSR